jgi:hypothetical protein
LEKSNIFSTTAKQADRHITSSYEYAVDNNLSAVINEQLKMTAPPATIPKRCKECKKVLEKSLFRAADDVC